MQVNVYEQGLRGAHRPACWHTGAVCITSLVRVIIYTAIRAIRTICTISCISIACRAVSRICCTACI